MTDKPTFRSTYILSVTQLFYDEVCDACGQPFADSYLFGATLIAKTLLPRTQTGWTMLRRNLDFMRVLRALDITLQKPPLWYPGCGRPSVNDLYTHFEHVPPPKRLAAK